ncbi:uncharacterized protein LOC126906966 isoform X2 [Daktulosphaira vitifoliae]|uniref:uncharacterized protein LOC126906966 isoform X2 n=1 Tax=Daktulosphaira vitifoliae TaxID=58002 RepID=UPI0021A9DF35|nr:uncharacterized protein LOC126906966 isoform X2 [Daktulosphaira vitifoliae]
MLYKTNSIVLNSMCVLFFFGNVCGNTILIGKEGVTDISLVSFFDGTVRNIGAEMKMDLHCFYPPEKYLQCGPVKMDFVNKNEIFAEIYLNYNPDFNLRTSPKIINIKMTFDEIFIVLNINRGIGNYFFYSENDINNTLQTFIRELDPRIKFKVVKIYRGHLDNNTSILNDTVYDETARKYLEKFENMSLWKYVKDDLIEWNYPKHSYVTLENFINNSTTYNVNVKFTLITVLNKMIERTIKYVLLLIAYVYEALTINYRMKSYWNRFIEVLYKLKVAEINLKKYDEIVNKIQQVKEKSSPVDKMSELIRLLKECTKHFYTAEEFEKLDFEETETSKSKYSNTHVLPEEVLNKVLKGFPKPHQNVDSYELHLIPTELDNIIEKMNLIFELIDVEYENICRIRF